MLRADYDSLNPMLKLSLVEDAIARLEAKESLSVNEREDLQTLKDELTDLRLNFARAAQNPYIPKSGTITCPRCSHSFSTAKEVTPA